MEKIFFLNNHMRTYNTNQFRFPRDISQPYIPFRYEADTLNSKLEQKKYLRNQEQPFNKYYYDYVQIIYEPEYFLNTQSINSDNLDNKIIQQQDEKNDSYVDDLDLNPDQMNNSVQNHLCQSKYCQQEFQNSNNMLISSQNLFNNYEYACKNAENISTQAYQNNFESPEKIKYICQNVFELNSEEIEANNSFTFQKTDNKNNLYQIELAEENKASSVIQKNKNRCTQNSLKNIVHAFMKHFKQLKDCKIVKELSSQQIQNFKKQLVRYMKQHSFNYSVVKYLTTHKIYKLILQNFLQNDSSEWLCKSKVIDKQEVQEKIQFLKDCIVDPKNLEELIDY
ncbi:hypothetical protein ABPG72_009757 [Tetrahymena utriculariae]